MAAFLDRLASRAQGRAPLVTLRVGSPFEPEPVAPEHFSPEYAEREPALALGQRGAPSGAARGDDVAPGADHLKAREQATSIDGDNGSRPARPRGPARSSSPPGTAMVDPAPASAPAPASTPEPAVAAVSQPAGEGEVAPDIDLDPPARKPRPDVPTIEQHPVQVRDPVRRPDMAADPAPARSQVPFVTGSAPERLAEQPLRAPRDRSLPRPARRGSPTALPARDELVADHVVPELRRAGLLGAGGDDRVELAAPWPVEPFEICGGAGRSEIHVHLGRVEVHQAASPAPVEPAPAPRSRRSTPRPGVDHDTYLARRRGDRGGERR